MKKKIFSIFFLILFSTFIVAQDFDEVLENTLEEFQETGSGNGMTEDPNEEPTGLYDDLKEQREAEIPEVASSSSAERRGFVKLEGAYYQSNSANDGDSFYVKHGGKVYIFRLYFVDTPETSNSYPKRVKSQQKYFKLKDEKETIKLGDEATDFVYDLLKGKPLTIYTKWEDARGASPIPRNYAIVHLKDGVDLAQKLAENGLVRIFGMPTDLPTGVSSSSYIRKLKTLEKEAKSKKRGGWK